MKITKKLLTQMGFKYSPVTGAYTYDGFSLSISSGLDITWLFFIEGLDAHDHYVTDIEELFTMIYNDAIKLGKDQKIKEIKDTIKDLMDTK